MVSLRTFQWPILGVALFYSFVLSPLLWTTLGVRRVIQDLSEFNATCEKVDTLGLEGCEHMWMHHGTGLLYIACSESKSRMQWVPSSGNHNVNGRTMKDRMAILDTRGSGPIASRLQWITPVGYPGTKHDNSLDLHGFDIQVGEGDDPTLKLILINHRPPVNSVTGEYLDATKLGANSTVELFESKLGATTMTYVKTYDADAIDTPNSIAWIGEGEFAFTNDRSQKVGLRRAFDIMKIVGGGSVGYCNDQDGCKIAADKIFAYPNGIVLGDNGLVYVASSVTGEIFVMEHTVNNTLIKVMTIPTGYPLDNLSKDANGEIYAAAFPKILQFVKSSKDPFGVFPASTVLKITSLGDTYKPEKVLEGSGTVPGTTVAVHDVQTGRFFLGGTLSPFISICETR